jgi:two-component system response regulator HydG
LAPQRDPGEPTRPSKFVGFGLLSTGAFQEANGGTLFLDEVGELPLELQARLLRVLESKEVKPVGADRPVRVDVRVVAATHRDLLSMVREGRFREDLYYRLSVIPVTLPPLRSRRGDIQLLAEHFVRDYAPDVAVKFTSAALAKLEQHPWPGNVRELRNVVARAMCGRKGPKLEARDITFDEVLQRYPEAVAEPTLELPKGVTLEEMLQRLERQLVKNTLRRCQNNKEQAAKELGMARSSLFRRLKEWGLTEGEE